MVFEHVRSRGDTFLQIIFQRWHSFSRRHGFFLLPPLSLSLSILFLLCFFVLCFSLFVWDSTDTHGPFYLHVTFCVAVTGDKIHVLLYVALCLFICLTIKLLYTDLMLQLSTTMTTKQQREKKKRIHRNKQREKLSCAILYVVYLLFVLCHGLFGRIGGWHFDSQVIIVQSMEWEAHRHKK